MYAGVCLAADCQGPKECATKQEVADVESVDVSLEGGTANIQLNTASYVDAWNRLTHLVSVVNEMGFEAEPSFAAEQE